MTNHKDDPLQPHAHEPNPEPPTTDPTITLTLPDGHEQKLTVFDLQKLPQQSISDCYIVSTGHGTSGPFTFTGPTLCQFINTFVSEPWTQVEVISADNFGNRVWRQELEAPYSTRPILLAYKVNGRPLTRQEGLIRLIVPSETDDALRQVKWVQQIRVLP